MGIPRASRTAVLTVLALVAFAANSVLARAALFGGAIDAASFSTLRLLSGALALSLLVRWRRRSARPEPTGTEGSWTSAVLLAVYAVPFSFAYLELSTGTGALILFGFVQITMIGGAVAAGERPTARQWTGLLLAGGGLVYLLLPGISAPPLGSALLMAVAGTGWGVYSLRGRGARAPITETRANFLRAVPLAVAVSLATAPALHVELEGALLAIASGALASGLGYTIWYAALPRLTSMSAGVVQLSVPVLAALAGVLLLSESVTFRLGASGVVVLGGIALATLHVPPGKTRDRSHLRP